MNIRYTLLDPTGNLTLLVETPVPEKAQPETARRLMALEPEAEQAGFASFTEDGAALRMAGGEFCGNAAMSAAALYLARAGREAGPVSVRVSGTPEPVEAVMAALPGGEWRGTVSMPRPLTVGPAALPGGESRPAARFPGIVHILMEAAMDPAEAEALAPAWCGHLRADALGLLFLDRAKMTLRPLVYVPAAGTLFWESSCASGTAAVGAILAAEAGAPVELPLAQPGGVLTVAAGPGGSPRLTGTVRILRSAEAEIY